MHVYLAEHLPKHKKIQLGGYYTPEKIVKLVQEFITPYIKQNEKKVVIFDSAGGCGAFLFDLKKYDYRIADCDSDACFFFKTTF